MLYVFSINLVKVKKIYFKRIPYQLLLWERGSTTATVRSEHKASTWVPPGKTRPTAQNCSAFLNLGRSCKNQIVQLDWTVGDPKFWGAKGHFRQYKDSRRRWICWVPQPTSAAAVASSNRIFARPRTFRPLLPLLSSIFHHVIHATRNVSKFMQRRRVQTSDFRNDIKWRTFCTISCDSRTLHPAKWT
jgi:hypothetical protein